MGPRKKSSASTEKIPIAPELLNIAEDNDRQPVLNGARKEVDQYLTFWKDLGLRDSHYKSINSREPRSNIERPREEQGQAKEKYKLHASKADERLLLLQFPNKHPHEPYCQSKGTKPRELRLKPATGNVEVDIPLNVKENFNEDKGSLYGAALKNSPLNQPEKNAGSAIGARDSASKIRQSESARSKGYHTDGRRITGPVMDSLTLGGRIVACKEGDPIYMMATFEGEASTWTRVDAIVQLRPQFSHLDALTAESKVTARQDRTTDDKAKDDKPEDVNMVIKTSADADGPDMYGGMNDTAKLLRAIRDEPWNQLDWNDQETDISKDMYRRNLQMSSDQTSPLLATRLTNDQYLEAVSCPRVDLKTQGMTVSKTLKLNIEDSSEEEEGPASENGRATRVQSGKEAQSHALREEYELVPEDAKQPDAQTERDIEKVCRLIFLSPPGVRSEIETRFRRLKPVRGHARSSAGLARFAFLQPEHKFYSYYAWRLKENLAGRGIRPIHDLPTTEL